jgi:hypothetical protein
VGPAHGPPVTTGAYYGRRIGDTSILKLDPTKAAELIKAFKEV